MRPFAFALCADDYAMTPGVSRGIVEALGACALSATSVMTTAEGWNAASAAALRPFEGQADIGLHLNLTLGAPLGPMPRLAPRGTLPTVGALVSAAQRGRLPEDEIAAEIGRQLDRFLAVAGRPPDHVDGHQHVQVLAPIRRALLRALAARGWRPWLRDSGDRPFRILRRGPPLAKAAGIAALSRGFAVQAGAAGYRTNDGFAGFSRFSEISYAEIFNRYLRSPGSAHLVMCHPGVVDDELRRLDPVTDSREAELSFLLSGEFARVLNRRQAGLVRLSALLSPASSFKGS